MRMEHHPWDFDVTMRFPNARAFRAWEGGCAYKAERDGKPFIIVDEGTMADFLDENDPTDQEVLSRLVTVIEFNDDAERNEYIVVEMIHGIQVSDSA